MGGGKLRRGETNILGFTFVRIEVLEKKAKDNKEERCQITPDLILIIWAEGGGGKKLESGEGVDFGLICGIYWKNFFLAMSKHIFFGKVRGSGEKENSLIKIRERKENSPNSPTDCVSFWRRHPWYRRLITCRLKFSKDSRCATCPTPPVHFHQRPVKQDNKVWESGTRLFYKIKDTSRVSRHFPWISLFVFPPFTSCTFTFHQKHNKQRNDSPENESKSD